MAYAAAKAALDTLTMSLARVLGPEIPRPCGVARGRQYRFRRRTQPRRAKESGRQVATKAPDRAGRRRPHDHGMCPFSEELDRRANCLRRRQVPRSSDGTTQRNPRPRAPELRCQRQRRPAPIFPSRICRSARFGSAAAMRRRGWGLRSVTRFSICPVRPGFSPAWRPRRLQPAQHPNLTI